MGSSKQTTHNEQSSSSTSSTTFKPMSAQEQQMLNQYQALGANQTQVLQDILSGRSPYQLSADDQASLDNAYAGAMNRFQTEGKDYADYLATTRGLNKSDTPVALEATNRYGMGMADLLSQKANAGLNMGLQATGMRLNATQATPAGYGAAFVPMYNERMASGVTNQSGHSSGFTTQRNTPSLMSQIGQGMGLASQAIGLGAQVGGLAMGMPMPSMGGGGMGTGAKANSWFS